MSEEHQEYCDKKVYPIIEKLVTQTLVARPELPVPFMVKWLAEETKKTIPTQKILIKEEIDGLQAEINLLEKQLAKLSEAVWVLAFGPNFDVRASGRQKGVGVLETERASAKGWRLSFSGKGIPMVEPAFANAERGDGEDELHGVAFQIPRDELHILDAAESGCDRMKLEFKTYSGTEQEGFIYTAKSHTRVEESPPSVRYLNALVKAAREASLEADYVDELAETSTYKVGAVTLKARQALPPADELRQISCEDLEDMGDDDQASHVSILGYIIRVPKAKIFVGSHRGRDVTSRVLRQWRGEPLDKDDDMGQPPYPKMDELTEEEQEYLNHWLDHYIWAGGSGSVVGFLSEFRGQLELEEESSELMTSARRRTGPASESEESSELMTAPRPRTRPIPESEESSEPMTSARRRTRPTSESEESSELPSR